MPCGQLVLGSGATRLQVNPQRAMKLEFQNNSAHPCRVGDSSSVSVTTPTAVAGGQPGFGILLYPTSSDNEGTYTSGAEQLNAWYVAGTSGDVIDYKYTIEV